MSKVPDVTIGSQTCSKAPHKSLKLSSILLLSNPSVTPLEKVEAAVEVFSDKDEEDRDSGSQGSSVDLNFLEVSLFRRIQWLSSLAATLICTLTIYR
jgi:hypothetical protein